MKEGIGEIIFQLRSESGMSQGQVCQGLCSVPQFARIEQNQTTAGHFLLDRIFGRLGKSTERLEYVLSLDVYELYELQYQIQRNICYYQFDSALELLETYEKKKMLDKPLHIQFIEQERAQIAWMQSEEIDKILFHLQSAIAQTMPLEDMFKKKSAFSAEELKLLLFRWEVCRGTAYARPESEVMELIAYINWRRMVEVEQVKIYPYAVLMWGRVCGNTRDQDELEACTRKALSVLRETGKILYMPEILEQYADILAHRNGDPALIDALRKERNCLLVVEEEYEIHFDKFRLFQHLNRRFEIDYEVLRRARMVRGLAQEKLCEDVCTQEELSRIETGKRKPRDKNMYELMERLNRKRERVNTIITTDEYEVLELKRKYCSKLHKFVYDEAEMILGKIEKRIDAALPDNQQFLRGERAKVMYNNHKISGLECLEQLEEALKITLDLTDEEKVRLGLTVEEHSILNEMAAVYFDMKEKEKAIEILTIQIHSMKSEHIHPVFHILEWQLAMGNMATAYEETGRTSQAVELCHNNIIMELEAGKGNDLGRFMVTMASALEQEKNPECVRLFLQGAHLMKLYKIEKRYDLVTGYIQSGEFVFKDELNNNYYRIPRLYQPLESEK